MWINLTGGTPPVHKLNVIFDLKPHIEIPRMVVPTFLVDHETKQQPNLQMVNRHHANFSKKKNVNNNQISPRMTV
jgi:hypothetical protein